MLQGSHGEDFIGGRTWEGVGGGHWPLGMGAAEEEREE